MENIEFRHSQIGLVTQTARHPLMCRLDFFLVTQSLMFNITSANILTGYKTDHSLIEITVATHSNMTGPGFWKLNTSLLTEMDYINQIRAVIKDTQEEYQNDIFVNNALMWEMIKLNIIRQQSLNESPRARTSPRFFAKIENGQNSSKLCMSICLHL